MLRVSDHTGLEDQKNKAIDDWDWDWLKISIYLDSISKKSHVHDNL